MKTVCLVNPNTSTLTTERMLHVARRSAGAGLNVTGVTASFGAPLITDEASLALAAEAVVAAVDAMTVEPDAIIISGFGDPGLRAVRSRRGCRVIGIAEASMIEAARDGRSFSVATTTPRLAAAIRRCAQEYGFGRQLLSVRITPGDPATVMADLPGLRAALGRAVADAIEQDGAEAVIIGGGPLAEAADDLERMFDVPIIGPIPAAVGLVLQ